MNSHGGWDEKIQMQVLQEEDAIFAQTQAMKRTYLRAEEA